MKSLHCSILTGLFGLSLIGGVQAHDEHAQHAEHAKATSYSNDSEVEFVNLPLTDQHGRTVRLREDLVDDRIVVMSFIYTTCSTVCPVVSSIMGRVQQQLGARVGSEVQLISITVDPQTDTPQRLLDYAGHFQSGPGWSWLTGTPHAVTHTLKALGTWNADYVNHPPVIMVGRGDARNWSRFYGFTDPEVLVAKVDDLSRAGANQHMDLGRQLGGQP